MNHQLQIYVVNKNRSNKFLMDITVLVSSDMNNAKNSVDIRSAKKLEWEF